MTHKQDKTESILDEYYQVHSQKKSLLLDYSYELFFTSITTKNVILMGYLIKVIDDDQFFYYHKHHLNSFYLMCLFYYKLTHDKTKQNKYSQLFNLNSESYAYNDFIKLLYKN